MTAPVESAREFAFRLRAEAFEGTWLKVEEATAAIEARDAAIRKEAFEEASLKALQIGVDLGMAAVGNIIAVALVAPPPPLEDKT